MRRILQFWSGGADSTYLLLQNLRCGYDVDCTYIKIANNSYKTKRELEAQKLLREDIAKFCKYFNCTVPTYLEDKQYGLSSIDIVFDKYPVACQQVTFATFAILLGAGYDEVQLAVVLGDSSRGATFAEGFREVYLQNITPKEKFPIITTPIADVSKEVIYLTLKGYDKAIGTDFINHITCCEQDKEEVCSSIDHLCEPCKTRLTAYKNLGWIKRKKHNLNIPADRVVVQDDHSTTEGVENE